MMWQLHFTREKEPVAQNKNLDLSNLFCGLSKVADFAEFSKLKQRRRSTRTIKELKIEALQNDFASGSCAIRRNCKKIQIN